MTLYDSIAELCNTIEENPSFIDTAVCLEKTAELQSKITEWAIENKTADCRLLKLLANLSFYLENTGTTLTYRNEVLSAIAVTLRRTADYDLNISPYPKRVKGRNQKIFELCDKLRAEPKEPLEENTGKPYDITIIMATYNQLELTKLCLDSVFKHTNDVSYELILIDNGSSDGTYEYFKNDERIKLIRLDVNTGLLLALHIFFEACIDNGKFWMYMNNDVIVTPRWASNMLTCIQSDARISAVLPATNRTAPFVCVQPPFGLYDVDSIESYGERFNRSNPNLWQDYLIFYGFVCLMRPSSRRKFGYYEDCFYFPFYYSDGDIILSQVKAGYRVIHDGGTYIHHFDGGHTVLQKRRESLATGERQFYNKYGFFPTDLEVNLPIPITAGAAGAAGATDYLFIGSARAHPLLQLQRINRIIGHENTGYYAVDTMEKLSLEQYGEEVHFRQIASWYDVESVFPEKRFDVAVYMDDIMKMRNPKRFLSSVFSRLNTNGSFYFIAENSGSLLAMEYIFMSKRKSPRDAVRLRKNSAYSIDMLIKVLNEVGFVLGAQESSYYNETFTYGRLENTAYYRDLAADKDVDALTQNINVPFRLIVARKPGGVDIDNTLDNILFGRGKS